MGNQTIKSSNTFSKIIKGRWKKTVKNSVLTSLEFAKYHIGKEETVRFSDDMMRLIEESFDDDLSDYSKERMKIGMMLLGYTEDDIFSQLKLIREHCLDLRIGIIDIVKPVELGNLAISLIEM